MRELLTWGWPLLAAAWMATWSMGKSPQKGLR